MTTYQKMIFLFGVALFLACGSQVEFLGEGEPSSEEECSLTKTISGKELCVEQRQQTFLVESLTGRPVDILFVLDVSPSMTEDLTRLGEAFTSLISQVQKSDWRMFFTTADHGDHDYGEDEQGQKVFSQQEWRNYQGLAPYFGRLMPLEYQGKKLTQTQLSPDTPDYVNVFKDTLTRAEGADCELAPYCQGSLEQPLRALKSGMERFAQAEGEDRNSTEAGAPLPRLRDSADFVSFIVTDEDERVEDPEAATTAKEVVDTFKKLFPKKAFYSFALLIQDEDCLAKERQSSPSAVYGERISELAKLTQGKNVSLCESDYGPPLEELSLLLRTLVESLELKETPVSLEGIAVEQVQKEEGASSPRALPAWELKGNKLVFEEALEEGGQIKVSYLVESSVKNP